MSSSAHPLSQLQKYEKLDKAKQKTNTKRYDSNMDLM